MRGLGIAAMAVLALSGCAEEKALYADNAWVRLGAARGNPGAAYFTLHGGATDARLLSVASPVVIRTELHESMGSGNMMSMKPIEGGVAVPANGTVEFQPGGKHVMLFDVNPGIQPPRELPLRLTFANGETLLVDAKVYRAGDPLPQ